MTTLPSRLTKADRRRQNRPRHRLHRFHSGEEHPRRDVIGIFLREQDVPAFPSWASHAGAPLDGWLDAVFDANLEELIGGDVG